MHPIDFSSPTVQIVLGIAVLALIIGIAIAADRHKRNTSKLRSRFGSEYDRAVAEGGSERRAHALLVDREARIRKLKLQELSATQRERYLFEWNAIQSRFLDHPKGALVDADELVTTILQARGYPATDFDKGLESVSVDFPRMTEGYRSAHAVAARSARGEASTEEMRTAMIEYRSLFDELVKPGVLLETRSVA